MEENMRMYEQGAALALATCAEEIAHELANPVAALGVLLDEISEKSVVDQELHDLARVEFNRLRALVGDMRSVVSPPLAVELVPLAHFISELGCDVKFGELCQSNPVTLPKGWREQIARPIADLLNRSRLDWKPTLSVGAKTTLDVGADVSKLKDKFDALPWQQGALRLSVARRMLRAHGHQVRIETSDAFCGIRLQFKTEKQS